MMRVAIERLPRLRGFCAGKEAPGRFRGVNFVNTENPNAQSCPFAPKLGYRDARNQYCLLPLVDLGA
jgi:hypothetical protein